MGIQIAVYPYISEAYAEQPILFENAYRFFVYLISSRSVQTVAESSFDKRYKLVFKHYAYDRYRNYDQRVRQQICLAMSVENHRSRYHKYEFHYSDKDSASRNGRNDRNYLQDGDNSVQKRSEKILFGYRNVHRYRHSGKKNGCRAVTYSPAEMHFCMFGYNACPYPDIIDEQLNGYQKSEIQKRTACVSDEFLFIEPVATIDDELVHSKRQQPQKRRKREPFYLIVQLIAHNAAHKHAGSDQKIR